MSQTDKIATKPKKKSKLTLDDIQLFLLSLPTTIWFIMFCYVPMFGILIAFKKYKVAPGKGFLWSLVYNSKWCGMDNFKFLFSSNMKTTIAMFRNTLGYNIVFIVLGIIIPVSLAVIISHLYSKKLAKVMSSLDSLFNMTSCSHATASRLVANPRFCVCFRSPL